MGSGYRVDHVQRTTVAVKGRLVEKLPLKNVGGAMSGHVRSLQQKLL